MSSRFVLSPKHSKVMRWNIVILIAMFYVSTVTPYEVRLGRGSEVVTARPLEGFASGLSLSGSLRVVSKLESQSPSSPLPPVGPRHAQTDARAHRSRS